jgi:anti-sigma B factor antagonist
MIAKVSEDEKRVTVSLSGDLNLATSSEVRKVLSEVSKSDSDKEIVVDVSNVRVIDSMGLATLIGGLKASRDKNVKFALAGVKGNVEEVLKISGLDSIFDRADAHAD